MKIKFLGWIASLSGKREMDIEIEAPVQLREILPFSLHERNIIVIVNNRPGSEQSVVKNEDNVTLMPVISGG